ncbi:dihydroorotase [Aureivirga sp. CE67]|uniref:dihydroorotase n=1 Tax=Aureivirga sp. CE67 TaxID=1788983 RepID=UPI0018C97E63|nr:dihydroorotase [Aureivirga sp. CE67]
MKVLIKSATIIDATSPFYQQTKDILVIDGKISKIDSTIENTGDFEEVNYENLLVSTGWFDTSVSLGEPGFEERETIANGLEVAAKSGFTSIALNANTNPVTDNKAQVHYLKNKALGFATKLFPIGSMTKHSEGKEIAEMFDMQQAGAIAFYDYAKSITNELLMKIALLYTQNFDGLVLSFPKNKAIAAEGFANEGINSTKLGMKGIPALAEELQVARDLFLLEYTGGKLHIPTISTKKSVALIREAKQKGLDVTCSVTPHHLLLTDAKLFDFDANSKVNPPLRTNEDTAALLEGVKDGTIDIITSDHNPLDVENKVLEFSNAMDGTIGMESLFGALNKVLDTETIVKCISENPRKRFGLETATIQEGANAELTLFSSEETYTFEEKHISSMSKNAIFLGEELKGKVFGIISDVVSLN